MFRTVGIAAAAAGIALTGAVALPPAASADTPGCVTRKEFRKVKMGMSKQRAHRIMDTAGQRRVISRGYGFVIEVRNYDTCTPYGVASISYEDRRVAGKVAVW